MKRLIVLIFVLLLAVPVLAEPEEKAAVFAAEQLPEYAFMDGVQFDETAMLLVEDAEGREYFAGFIREDGVGPLAEWLEALKNESSLF